MIAVLVHPQPTWAQVMWLIAMVLAVVTAYAAHRAHVLAPVGLPAVIFFVALGLFLVF